MRDAAPTTQAQRESSDKPKPRKRKRKSTRQVVCQICHQSFSSITAEHLRTHGFTLTRYRRVYLAPTRAPGGSPARSDDPAAPTDRQTVATIAERIVHDPDVIREMAGEVAEAIFGSSLRDALRISLVSVVSERLKAHGHAVNALNQVREELAQPWRTQQGGPNGTPTPTKDLLGMASVLNTEVKTGEELLLKTIKLAVEEWRSHKGAGAVEGGLPDRFTGDGERLPVPAQLSAQDRETIRTLWGMFDKAVTTKRVMTIDVPAESRTSSPDAGTVPAEPPSPPAEPSSEVPPAEGNGSFTPSSLRGDDEPF